MTLQSENKQQLSSLQYTTTNHPALSLECISDEILVLLPLTNPRVITIETALQPIVHTSALALLYQYIGIGQNTSHVISDEKTEGSKKFIMWLSYIARPLTEPGQN